MTTCVGRLGRIRGQNTEVLHVCISGEFWDLSLYPSGLSEPDATWVCRERFRAAQPNPVTIATLTDVPVFIGKVGAK